MKITGTPDEILAYIAPLDDYPKLPDALYNARSNIKQTKREIWHYQAACLYALSSRYNVKGSQALEIGTATGYSAAVLAQALSEGRVITLNPKQVEFVEAVINLKPYHNVYVDRVMSWDYLVQWQHMNQKLDFIFVDGNHNCLAKDLDWFNELKTGGMILFHDYAPTGSKRPCQPVYDICNAMRDSLGRDFDVEIIDRQNVGMVGFVRQANEALNGIAHFGDGWQLSDGKWKCQSKE